MKSFIYLNEGFVQSACPVLYRSPHKLVLISLVTHNVTAVVSSVKNILSSLFLLPRQLYLQPAAGEQRENAENVMDCRAHVNSHFVITH